VKLSERYPSVADLPSAIPVFPLSGALVLPRANLPLNIFEPRYLEMFDDALSGARLVGMIQPARDTPNREKTADGPLPLRQIGCVGRIVAFQEQDDGRMIVSLAGVCRFRVAAEVATGKAYRVCQIESAAFANDLTPDYGADAVDREALLTALKRFLEARQLKADWTSIGRSPNEALVNSLAVMSPYGAEEKQALLEAVDLKTRADILVALAEMEIASAGRGGGSGSGNTLQ
jgi:uncharacterized protein